MSTRTILVSVLAIGLARVSAGQVPPEERIPITDPDRLAAFGLPQGAGNVYVWSKLDRSSAAVVDEDPAATPDTWGGNTGYTNLHGMELQGQHEGIELGRWNLYGDCNHSDGSANAWAQIPFPEGVRLGVFRSWAYDSHATQDLWFRIWEVCEPYGYDPPTITLIAENQTLGAIGNIPGTKSLNNLTVNNQLCAYTVQVEFAPIGGECQSDELVVRKFQFTWTRQVSPAPATASFQDVPTNHQFFRFIEALKESGITAGCRVAPPLFCPNDPITRGQMAVFLAAALGLNGPN